MDWMNLELANFLLGVCAVLFGGACFGAGWSLRGQHERRDERQAEREQR